MRVTGPKLSTHLVYTVAKEGNVPLHVTTHSGDGITGVHAKAQRRVGFHTESGQVVECLPRPALVATVNDVHGHELLRRQRVEVSGFMTRGQLCLAVDSRQVGPPGDLDEACPVLAL